MVNDTLTRKNISSITFPFEGFAQNICFLSDENNFQYEALFAMQIKTRAQHL
jgi:hypothetical protein